MLFRNGQSFYSRAAGGIGRLSVASAAFCAAVTLAAAPAFPNASENGGKAENAINTNIDRLDEPALKLRQPDKAALQTVIRSGKRLIAAGQRGAIIYSDDEGATWTQASSPVKVSLTSVIARPDGLAIAVGHDAAILRSTDNGATWSKVTDGRELLPRMIKDMEQRYLDAKAIFDRQQAEQNASEAAGADDAAADETGEGASPADASGSDPAVTADAEEPIIDEFVLEDLDFRVDTMKQSMEFGPAWPFLDVFFLSGDQNEDRVMAIGAFGMAFLSEDAGQSWKLVNRALENEQDLHLNSGFVTKSGAILIASEQGFVFRSEPGELKFTPLETFDGRSFFDMAKVPGTDKIVAYGFGDTYHFSTDEGATWTSAPLSESLPLSGSVVLPTGGLGVMGEGGQMFEIGPDGERRRFRPIDTRKVLGDAVPISGSRVLFVSEIGVSIADKL